MAGPYQRLSNGQSADSGAQAITTVVNAVEAGLEDAEATITAQAALIAGKSDTAHAHTGTYDPAGSAATAQAAAVQRANHSGSQLASTISDFNTAVRANRLDQMAAPTTAVGMGSQKITNLATPTVSTDAATKAYADSLSGALHGWFNVRSYGATGDGSTNDTAAINSAIAALNAAGRGVLYFPVGDYSTTGGLTTITAACTVRGEGSGDQLGDNVQTKIRSSSSTANLFTVTTRGTRFIGLGLFCTAATPTAGAGISIQAPSGTQGGDGNRYRDLSIHHFYINLDVQDGAEWFMDNCFFYNPVLYNVKIQHADLVDGGDQSIVNCQFVTRGEYTHNPTAHVRLESGGGLKITNCKFNGYPGVNAAAYCVDASIGNGVNTAVLTLTGNSMENWTAGAVRLVQTGTGTYHFINITGNQMAPYGSGSGKVYVTLTATSTTAVREVSIVGNTFVGAYAAHTGVVATNVGGLTIGPNHYETNVSKTHSLSGCSRVRDFDALV